MTETGSFPQFGLLVGDLVVIVANLNALMGVIDCDVGGNDSKSDYSFQQPIMKFARTGSTWNNAQRDFLMTLVDVNDTSWRRGVFLRFWRQALFAERSVVCRKQVLFWSTQQFDGEDFVALDFSARGEEVG